MLHMWSKPLAREFLVVAVSLRPKRGGKEVMALSELGGCVAVAQGRSASRCVCVPPPLRMNHEQ